MEIVLLILAELHRHSVLGAQDLSHCSLIELNAIRVLSQDCDCDDDISS